MYILFESTHILTDKSEKLKYVPMSQYSASCGTYPVNLDAWLSGGGAQRHY